MPTDVVRSFADRRARDKKSAADLRAVVLLIPMIVCLLSLSLSLEYPAIQTGLVSMASAE